MYANSNRIFLIKSGWKLLILLPFGYKPTINKWRCYSLVITHERMATTKKFCTIDARKAQIMQNA